MKTLKYIVYKEGEFYVSQCLNVEVSSFGISIQEAIDNLKEALELFFENNTASGKIKPIYGNRLLLDTNIVLYLLGGDETLVSLLEEKNLFVSFITQLELLSYKGISNHDSDKIMLFLDECTIIDITAKIKEITIHLRKEYKLKLPDGIIIATAIWLNMPVISSVVA